MQENLRTSHRKSSPLASCTKTTLGRIVRKDLGKKFYWCTSVQPLTDVQKSQRRNFCQWVLKQLPDIVKKIVWTEEKLFYLHQTLRRKNDLVRTDENPLHNDEKVMIFVINVHDVSPIVHAFHDLYGNKASVNGVSYLNLLPEVACPQLHQIVDRSALW